MSGITFQFRLLEEKGLEKLGCIVVDEGRSGSGMSLQNQTGESPETAHQGFAGPGVAPRCCINLSANATPVAE